MSFAASNSRKRPAPSTTPMTPVAQIHPAFSPGLTDQVLGWNGMIDHTSRNLPNFAAMQPHSQYAPEQGVAPTSTALARRGINNALVPSARGSTFDPNTSWNHFGDNGALVQQGPANGVVDENDSIEHLEEKAQRAKREAQAKRKQIPPFVQKLSSFLDESRNTDLIRWSEKGDSFIVLDEDEFAKTLIPELFKHNNYASFVRQLNMYGFHKRVGLSDNSMKASERKNKSPSEYYNPYFRRGHPNLLWLINKPKGGGNKKKGKKEEGVDCESEDDVAQEDSFTNANYLNPAPVGGRTPSSEVGAFQKKDFVQLKDEITRIQQQQAAMADMLTKIRRDHAVIANQATMFQNQHNRHEQSINAILTFLANVFRKSIDEQGGAQTVQDLMGNLIPTGQVHTQNQMHQGNIVDLGDYVAAAAGQADNSGASPMTALKRTQRLLPAASQVGGRAGTVSPSPATPTHQPGHYQVPQMGSVTELFDASPAEATSPAAFIKNELQAKPSESMMKIIHETNAGKSPLIPGHNKTPQSPMGVGPGPHLNRAPLVSNASSPAPVSPIPGHASASPTNRSISSPPTTAFPGLSLSPILSTIPPPNLHDINASQADIEAFQRLQDSQAQKIDEISQLLGPLSPSGRIPGVDGEVTGGGDYFNFDQYFDPNSLDPNTLPDLNYDAAFTTGSASTTTDGNDFNFTLDGAQELPHGGDPGSGTFPLGRVLDAQSGANSPSTASTETVPRFDLDEVTRDPKRRRVG